jgi:hypothetical protein
MKRGDNKTKQKLHNGCNKTSSINNYFGYSSLNSPTKGHKVTRWIKKDKTQLYP